MSQEGAWYAHGDPFTTKYWKYGLAVDYARYPNIGSKFSGEAGTILERAFMRGLFEAIKLGEIDIEPKEGKFIAAFELDWPKFVETYERSHRKS